MSDRLAFCSGLLAAGLVQLAAPAAAQSEILLRTGEILPGAGSIIEVGELASNRSGSWAVLVRTDAFGPEDAVIIRDGVVVTEY